MARNRVMDWEHPANNDFLMVRQFTVTDALPRLPARICWPMSWVSRTCVQRIRHRVDACRRIASDAFQDWPTMWWIP